MKPGLGSELWSGCMLGVDESSQQLCDNEVFDMWPAGVILSRVSTTGTL
jgi:hypothetical protein